MEFYCYLTWMSFKREAQEKFQVESRFYETIGCNYVTLLTTYLAKKTMLKVSNRNTRKRCLLISKITLKTSGQRHLTTSYLTEVIVQNHLLDSFCNQKSTFSSAFKFDVPQYLIHENSKCQHFFISGKKGPKTDKLFNLLPYIQRDAISVLQS